MKKSAIISSIDYFVLLSFNQFNNLEKRDSYNLDLSNHLDLNTILTNLTHSSDIEFNGHFGSAVFFSLRSEHSDDSEVIAKIIKMYANKKSYSDIFKESLNSNYNHKKNTGFISSFEYQMQLFKP